MVSSAEDFGQTLNGKHLLERIKRARRYDKKASEARHIIEVSRMTRPQLEKGSDIIVQRMLPPQTEALCRPNRS